MSDTQLVYNIVARDRATGTIDAIAARHRAASVVSAAGSVAMGAAMASAAAHAVALGSSIGSTVGVIGLLPGVALAAGAGVTGLALGVIGLGKAFGAAGATSTGSAAAQTAALRRVESAERSAAQSLQRLNDVRREAQERIDGYTRRLEDARLSEEEATQAVADAERRLNEAGASGRLEDITKADIAYRRAQYTLREVQERVEELSDEHHQAARAGVDGATDVQKATQAHADAVRDLADAKRAMADAGGGAMSAEAEAYAALAPSARDLVDTLHDLGPAWGDLQQSVQQRMFAGVAGDVRALSGQYLPVLSGRLGEIGGAWNTVLRSSAGLLRSRDMVRDVDQSLADTTTAANTLARAVVPVWSGIRHIGVVATSFLPGIAAGTLSISERFERWAASARETGRMQQWISTGLGALRQLGAVGADVLGIIRGIFRAGDDGGSTLDGLERGAAAVRAWVDSAQGQQKIGAFFSSLRSILASVADVAPHVATAAMNLAPALSGVVAPGGALTDVMQLTGVVAGFLVDHLDLLVPLLPLLAAGFVLGRAAQVGANVAAVASLPIKAAQVAANWGLRSAIRANTAAVRGNTVASRGAAAAERASTAATVAGDGARRRGVLSMIAQKTAAVAANIATKAWAAGQWLLNAAMSASPLGLILVGVMLLIGGIVLLWKNSETFRSIVTGVWSAIKKATMSVVSWLTDTAWPAIKKVWTWISDGVTNVFKVYVSTWGKIIDLVTGLPKRISTAASGMWDGVKTAFKSAVNWIIGRWNGLAFTIPSVTFAGVTTPGFTLGTPDIPYLATGGRTVLPGVARVGERGPEDVFLPGGAVVQPLGAGDRYAGGGRTILEIRSSGRRIDDFIVELIRRAVRTRGNGIVQLAFGVNP